MYEDNVCWFSHGDHDDKNSETREPGYKCSFCEQVFNTMAQLLVHRKESHTDTKMFRCRDDRKGACRFSSDDCWFKHDDILVDREGKDTSKPVFQNAKVNLHPPDLIEKIVSMMEILTKKVSILEKEAQPSQ